MRGYSPQNAGDPGSNPASIPFIMKSCQYVPLMSDCCKVFPAKQSQRRFEFTDIAAVF